VLPALAGVVHDRSGPDYDHRHGEDDQYGGFHCDLATTGPNTCRSRFFVVQNEPTVNEQDGLKRLIAAQIARLGRISMGNSAQYHYDNKYSRERYANRFCYRTLVAHHHNLDLQNDRNTYLVDNSLR
jgi:hypothetical protein